MTSDGEQRLEDGTLKWHTRTWYGVPVDVTVAENNFHRVKAGVVVLPHPGVVNWLARTGLPLRLRLELTARHELGHLQTLPVPLLHLVLLLWPRRGKPYGSRWQRLALGLLAHQAVWEVAAEGYLVATDARAVRLLRRRYALFWSLMGGLAALSTYLLLARQEK